MPSTALTSRQESDLASSETWAAAAEVVNAPVSEALPLARRKPGAAAYVWVGASIFAVIVFHHESK